MKLLKGRPLADQIQADVAKEVAARSRPPGLAVVLVGDDPASHTYVRMKRKRCSEVGIHSELVELPSSTDKLRLFDEIDRLNAADEIDGILVQLPLPFDPLEVVERIDPAKDVDGLHPINMGRLLRGERSGFIPCTPLGIHHLLLHYEIPIDGAHVVIIGRSQIVGRPLAALLSQKAPDCNATVTMAHSRTRSLADLTRSADIIVTALGSPRFLKGDMVGEGAVVIDVGISRKCGKLVGDVDFEEVSKVCSAITPVPGGVGPLTIAMLLRNVVR